MEASNSPRCRVVFPEPSDSAEELSVMLFSGLPRTNGYTGDDNNNCTLDSDEERKDSKGRDSEVNRWKDGQSGLYKANTD